VGFRIMISKAHKTIFIHIPKAGGQSIETMFLNTIGLQWESRAELLLRKKNPEEKGPYRLAHLRARDYVGYGYIDEQQFDDYFKFTFVRNPYKRVFSLYNFLGFSKIISLKTFIEKVLLDKIESDQYFFRTQYDYVYDHEGNPMTDFIGKLETIDQDIQEVILRAGLNNAILPHVNKSRGEWKRALSILFENPMLISNLRLSNSNNFEKVFTDSLKDKVYQLYKNDFIHFGYDR
jgi:hypothetical protein